MLFKRSEDQFLLDTSNRESLGDFLESKRKGEMHFTLPLFKEFVLDLVEFDEAYS